MRDDLARKPDGGLQQWDPTVGKWRDVAPVAQAFDRLVVHRDAIPQTFGNRGWSTLFTSADTDWRGDWGAFQRDTQVSQYGALSFNPVYACITRISNDIGKLEQGLKRKLASGILEAYQSAAFSPVIDTPNHFQNHVQFKQWWLVSKLERGNTYALKQRDARGVVTALYVLDPDRVTPLITPEGDVLYRLGEDNLSGLTDASLVVPASEIIHDRMNCLFHPLVGISPLFAACLAAAQGLDIQRDSLRFFRNASRPSGILTAPAGISDATAKRAKEWWDQEFGGGKNPGKIVALGDGLKFESLTMKAVDSEAAKQLELSAQFVCSAFGIPAFKLGYAPLPVGTKVADMNQIYYNDCLQVLITEYEECMDDGLGLPEVYRFKLDIDGLLRMDMASLVTMLGDAVQKSLMAPNEGRLRLNLKPIQGGDTIYMQHQDYSIQALAKRDESDDPFGTAAPPAPAPEPDTSAEDAANGAKAVAQAAVDAVIILTEQVKAMREQMEAERVSRETQDADRAKAQEAEQQAAAVAADIIARFTDAARPTV